MGSSKTGPVFAVFVILVLLADPSQGQTTGTAGKDDYPAFKARGSNIFTRKFAGERAKSSLSKRAGLAASTPVTGWQWLNPLPQGNDLFSVAVLGPDTVIAAGAAGTIIRTNDGGKSWSVLPRFAGSTPIEAVRFVDHHFGYAVNEGGVILRSKDAGLNWSVIGLIDEVSLHDVGIWRNDFALAVGGYSPGGGGQF